MREGMTPAQVIRAVFPGGTITGCPKVRCMQIIAELEQAPRGAYTGSMGYINRDGSLDLNILIRTMVQDGTVKFRCAPAPASWPIRFRNGSWPKPAPRPRACSPHWVLHDRIQ